MTDKKPMRAGFANLIYEIFIGRLGCLEENRAEFVHWVDRLGGQGDEYRLNSTIGPGTKFRYYRDKWYVDYYQEFSKTDKQKADVAHVNELLSVLYNVSK